MGIIGGGGGGFKHFLFSSLFGEDFQFDSYFSNGLKPPTSFTFQNIGDHTTQLYGNYNKPL